MNSTKLKKMNRLMKMVRSGKATAAQEAEAVALELELFPAQACPVANSIMDLPVARALWNADMRDLGA